MKKYIESQSGSTIHSSSLHLRKDGTFAYRPRVRVIKGNRMQRIIKSLVSLFSTPLA